jgi:hypothetical protein
MTRVVGIAIALLMVAGFAIDPALALDQPVFGQKLVIKRAASGKDKLVVLLKDPTLIFPTIGGADDPSTVGMLARRRSLCERHGVLLRLLRRDRHL